MSDQDISHSEPESAEDAELRAYMEKQEAPEAPEDETQDPVVDPAEESQEEVEEISEEPSETDAGDPDLTHLLEQIPEDFRHIAEQYGQGRVSGLQRSLTPKLEEAARQREKLAELEEARKTVETFNERFTKDPKGLLDFYRQKAIEAGYLSENGDVPQAPQPPGEAPDPVEDPQAFNRWLEARDAWKDHLLEQRLAKEREAITPMKDMLEQAKIAQARAAVKQMLQAEDDEMTEMDAISAEVRKDAAAAPKVLLELVRLRKQVAAQQKTTRKVSQEAARGVDSLDAPRT